MSWQYSFSRHLPPTDFVLESIDVFHEETVFTTQCGRKFKIYHEQDCCESVYMVDSLGNPKELIGKTIREVQFGEPDDAFQDAYLAEQCSYPPESYTFTEVRFVCDDMTYVERWFGESNGCYSEEVDVSEWIANQ